MDGIGARLKARARELGLSDTKVAERVGLSQTRYATYTIDKFEPDLTTLMRICKELSISPNDLLGWADEEVGSEAEGITRKIVSNSSLLNLTTLRTVDIIISALLANEQKSKNP